MNVAQKLIQISSPASPLTPLLWCYGRGINGVTVFSDFYTLEFEKPNIINKLFTHEGQKKMTMLQVTLTKLVGCIWRWKICATHENLSGYAFSNFSMDFAWSNFANSPCLCPVTKWMRHIVLPLSVLPYVRHTRVKFLVQVHCKVNMLYIVMILYMWKRLG